MAEETVETSVAPMLDPARKDLKVSISIPVYMGLMQLKMLHRQTMASTVEEALKAYFASHEVPGGK